MKNQTGNKMEAENLEVSEPVDELPPPTEHQGDSIEFLINAITEKKPVVGFIAPGGCGKTFSLKHIAKDSRLSSHEITFTATTNKAATVMRKEGLPDAVTLHSAISSFVPTEMYATMERLFFDRKKEGIILDIIPSIITDFLDDIEVKHDDFYSYSNEKELIAENGVGGFDDRVFSHYSTGEYKGGTVFVDESSMLPTKSQYSNDGKMKAIGLDAVTEVYDTVVLVGDDSQLPPINGTSSFDAIEKTTLTENLRADTSLLRVLDHARKGYNLANFEPSKDENVRVVASLSDEYFNIDTLIKQNATHIVYRNKTRKEITKKIRDGKSSDPVLNEPIVYKGPNIDEGKDRVSKNETGFFNGVVGEWEDHKQIVSGRNFDEYGDGFTYLQYGYAITAHCAQGSSFDYVIVHIDDVPHFIKGEERRKWIYTAVSRARKGIVIVY